MNRTQLPTSGDDRERAFPAYRQSNGTFRCYVRRVWDSNPRGRVNALAVFKTHMPRPG